ncbi:amidohydrolase [Microbacteriaceae bacterium K1510]|nr:amidohydrolase [Microbacteriaceae bacterium K1510]
MADFDKINGYRNELVGIRHDLHQHPELGFQETRTSGVIARQLEAWGIAVHRGIGGTGVVGVLSGNGGSGRRIGLRAEMDALPIEEATNLPYRSRTPGIFHGCGHDGHMTMLLGAARYLAETRDFPGTAIFIFQPAEEGLGGARAMIADGLFTRFPCDEIYAIHNDPTGPFGSVTLRPGAAMAAADFIDIKISGRGAHAAEPHRSVDPVAVGVAVVQALQTIVSRNIDPLHSAVVSITKFQSGNAHNVIPHTAELAGTVRTFEAATRALVASRMRDICAGLATSFGAEIDLAIRSVFSVLENWPEQTAAAAAIAGGLFGDANVDASAPLRLTSEDFADMLQVVPGAYFLLGQAEGPALHNAHYVFDDKLIPRGALMLATLVEQRTRG